MAKAITEAHDARDSPQSVLRAGLLVVKQQFRVVDRFDIIPKGGGHYRVMMIASEHEVDDDYTPGREELNARRRRVDKVELANELTVRGFRNAGEFVERMGNLRNRLKNLNIKGMSLDDINVGLRGSSVTGNSTKGGVFRMGVDSDRPSDLDFFFSSQKLEDLARRKGLRFKDGRMSPESLRVLDEQLYNTLKQFGDATRSQTGRSSSAYLLSRDLIEHLEPREFILN